MVLSSSPSPSPSPSISRASVEQWPSSLSSSLDTDPSCPVAALSLMLLPCWSISGNLEPSSLMQRPFFVLLWLLTMTFCPAAGKPFPRQLLGEDTGLSSNDEPFMYSLTELLDVDEERRGLGESASAGDERCFGVEPVDSGGGVGMIRCALSGSKLISEEHVVVVAPSSPSEPTNSAGSSNPVEGYGDAM